MWEHHFSSTSLGAFGRPVNHRAPFLPSASQKWVGNSGQPMRIFHSLNHSDRVKGGHVMPAIRDSCVIEIWKRAFLLQWLGAREIQSRQAGWSLGHRCCGQTPWVLVVLLLFLGFLTCKIRQITAPSLSGATRGRNT